MYLINKSVLYKHFEEFTISLNGCCNSKQEQQSGNTDTVDRSDRSMVQSSVKDANLAAHDFVMRRYRRRSFRDFPLFHLCLLLLAQIIPFRWSEVNKVFAVSCSQSGYQPNVRLYYYSQG